MGDELAPAGKRLQVETRDAHGRADHKNRSAMRTWGLMLYASMLLFLSVGILFLNASIWKLNCSSEKVDKPLPQG